MAGSQEKLIKSSQTKCPSCGDTKISLNTKTALLRCHSCRYEFEHKKFKKIVDNITSLENTVVGQGAQRIASDGSDLLTLKCSSCQAEVVVDTSESLQARCHWCRSVLSVNQQIPNGAVPDMVLPFSTTKEEAQVEITKFVDRLKHFAHPKFKKGFTAEDVVGVYLPYMVVDASASAHFSGEGEKLIEECQYRQTSYIVDLYDINRYFDLVVEGLTIESSADKLRYHSCFQAANNVIDAIKPFDTENSIKWNANFLHGFTSQKRDINIDHLLKPMVVKMKDIARNQIRSTLKVYDRGVRWDAEKLNVKGMQWKAAYLPIWLYSYQIRKSIHYVAVNGRTLKTMGSIPINWILLWVHTLIIVAITAPFGISLLLTGVNAMLQDYMVIGTIVVFIALLLLAVAPIFYTKTYGVYRNQNARYQHETEANAQVSNVRKFDSFLKTRETKRKEVRNRNDKEVYY